MARSTHALAWGVQRACRPGGSSPSPSARRRAGAAPDGSARHASGKQRGRQMHRHDPGRTRACNLWFRRPTPYPLGHRATCMSFLGRQHPPPPARPPPGMALAQGAPTPERAPRFGEGPPRTQSERAPPIGRGAPTPAPRCFQTHCCERAWARAAQPPSHHAQPTPAPPPPAGAGCVIRRS